MNTHSHSLRRGQGTSHSGSDHVCVYAQTTLMMKFPLPDDLDNSAAWCCLSDGRGTAAPRGSRASSVSMAIIIKGSESPSVTSGKIKRAQVKTVFPRHSQSDFQEICCWCKFLQSPRRQSLITLNMNWNNFEWAENHVPDKMSRRQGQRGLKRTRGKDANLSGEDDYFNLAGYRKFDI